MLFIILAPHAVAVRVQSHSHGCIGRAKQVTSGEKEIRNRILAKPVTTMMTKLLLTTRMAIAKRRTRARKRKRTRTRRLQTKRL